MNRRVLDILEAVVAGRLDRVTKANAAWLLAAARALAARGGTPTFRGLACIGSLLCCGRAPKVVEVKGTFRPAHKCDARCLSSVGGKCECACGGKNHGMGYAAAEA